MTKRRYRTRDFKRVDWSRVGEVCDAERTVLAVDVAKEDFVASVMRDDATVVETVKWRHPCDTRELVEAVLGSIGGENLEVVMEPTGTYGDALRSVFERAQVALYAVSPKRVHDAAEIFDGVPSLHDAKAAYLIGRLHLDGASRPWEPTPLRRREAKAYLSLLGVYQGRYQRALNRLEALLSRHWPEASQVLDLGSVTLHCLIGAYGAPDTVAAQRDEAAALMRRISRTQLSVKKIEQLLDSAGTTVGMPCIEAERQVLRALAEDLEHTRRARRELERIIEGYVNDDEVSARMAEAVGKTTTAVALGGVGDPCAYPDADSYLKAFGLNLKERSSGKYQGKLKITKRGPGVARKYLYFAALRSIKDDPVIQCWYRQKVARDGGVKNKAITAVMRKLVKALWHVARGSRFDATKLFDCRHLARAA